MKLTKIHLNQFRNFQDSLFDIDKNLTVILGENARGKSNLLEAVYFSINGEGYRESREEELILWEKDTAFVESSFEDNGSDTSFQIFLHKRGETVEKKFSVSKTQKTHKQYREYQMRAVLFSPENIDIIAGSPDIRRAYFNTTISLFDYEYKRKLTNYEHALRKRNKVLEFYRDEESLKEELAFWNSYLEEQALYITAKRQEYVDFLNAHKEVQHRLFEIEYQKNELSRERLEARYDIEKKWRKTTIGPQKDEFIISLIEEGVKENVHLYGSRSEQRLAVFWLKLNEIRFLEIYFKQKPLLLLDDVFSELDVKNKKLIMDLTKDYQTIITTTEDSVNDVDVSNGSMVKIR